MNDNLVDRVLVEDDVGDDLGNVSVDPLATGIAGFVFLLFAKLAGGEETINFQRFEQANSKSTLQFQFSVTAFFSSLVGDDVSFLPPQLLVRQEVVPARR